MASPPSLFGYVFAVASESMSPEMRYVEGDSNPGGALTALSFTTNVGAAAADARLEPKSMALSLKTRRAKKPLPRDEQKQNSRKARASNASYGLNRSRLEPSTHIAVYCRYDPH